MTDLLQTFSNMNRPARLDEVALSPAWRVMVLAPHPDDFDAVGVTMRLFKDNGNSIFVAVVSGSASGVLDEYRPGADHADKARFREEEQYDSARSFGLPDDHLRFLRLPEDEAGDPIEDDGNELEIREALERVRPDIVFLPHGCDTNAGHQRVFSMFRRIAAEWKQPLVAFYIRDPKTVECRLDAWLGFNEEAAQWKSALLRLHRTQQHRNMTLRGYGFDERLLQVNRNIAKDIGCPEPYAEAFELEIFGLPAM